MPLSESAARNELGKAFDKNSSGYLGPVSTNAESRSRTVTGWANALEAAATGVTPPSTTVAAARAALEASMAGSFNDMTGAAFLAAFQAFAAALATGMAPTFIATPPPSPPVLNSPMPALSDALDAHAAALIAWLQTGTATPAAGGAPVNWA